MGAGVALGLAASSAQAATLTLDNVELGDFFGSISGGVVTVEQSSNDDTWFVRRFVGDEFFHFTKESGAQFFSAANATHLDGLFVIDQYTTTLFSGQLEDTTETSVNWETGEVRWLVRDFWMPPSLQIEADAVVISAQAPWLKFVRAEAEEAGIYEAVLSSINFFEANMTPVPAPAGGVLLFAGLGMLALMRRDRPARALALSFC